MTPLFIILRHRHFSRAVAREKSVMAHVPAIKAARTPRPRSPRRRNAVLREMPSANKGSPPSIARASTQLFMKGVMRIEKRRAASWGTGGSGSYYQYRCGDYWYDRIYR